ncbi:arsenosugar biosynthesis radical SAM (seleno)protein ArsS [Panacagrimonas sp.]|uniref:arsenosugar biosynthesis radical SAM (seleno)protein ArsS n=1 Tax=Panacagrimonas sp. TaxID=2480088 RepID=UPI003B51CC26
MNAPDGVTAPPPTRFDFQAQLDRAGVQLPVREVRTLQINLTKTCNQACRHCHVDASPARTEALSDAGVEQCLKILAAHSQIQVLDLTGGAPELHPRFDELVQRARALDRHVMVRHNLTVQFDGHPVTGASKAYLPEFFAAQRVEVVSSLPYYQAFMTDTQRGKGVFDKSVDAIRRLNDVGYGLDGSGLMLNLVYNPVGPYLPAAQASLEADFKRELLDKFGLRFNGLFTITNMPIHRFALHLQKSGQYRSYMDKLLGAFNPAAAQNVMCRDIISVSHDGRIFDCDFNQMLDLQARGIDGEGLNIFDFDVERVLKRPIRFGDHCLGCTAGAGSSCGGATA